MGCGRIRQGGPSLQSHSSITKLVLLLCPLATKEMRCRRTRQGRAISLAPHLREACAPHQLPHLVHVRADLFGARTAVPR